MPGLDPQRLDPQPDPPHGEPGESRYNLGRKRGSHYPLQSPGVTHTLGKSTERPARPALLPSRQPVTSPQAASAASESTNFPAPQCGCLRRASMSTAAMASGVRSGHCRGARLRSCCPANPFLARPLQPLIARLPDHSIALTERAHLKHLSLGFHHKPHLFFHGISPAPGHELLLSGGHPPSLDCYPCSRAKVLSMYQVCTSFPAKS